MPTARSKLLLQVAGWLISFSLGVFRAMLEIIYCVASSLDGYIATKDGSVDWLSRFHRRGEDDGAGDLEASIDALLLGSRTYEFALKLGRWPSPDKPSWVFTQRKLPILDPSITLTAETPVEVVHKLARRGCRRAWLMGGGKLAASFHAEQLISRYIISVFPVLLGSGIPAFAPHPAIVDALRFVKAKPYKSGIVQLTYETTKTANAMQQTAR
jgi:dihydrofolate reductase